MSPSPLPQAPAGAKTEVIRRLSPLVKEDLEPCGHGFFELYEKTFAQKVVFDASPAGTEESSDASPLKNINEKKAKTRSGFVKLDENMKGVDL